MPRAPNGPNGVNGVAKGDLSSPLNAEAEEARNREIAAKAVTGIMVLLLKWLKLSRMPPAPPGGPRAILLPPRNLPEC